MTTINQAQLRVARDIRISVQSAHVCSPVGVATWRTTAWVPRRRRGRGHILWRPRVRARGECRRRPHLPPPPRTHTHAPATSATAATPHPTPPLVEPRPLCAPPCLRPYPTPSPLCSARDAPSRSHLPRGIGGSQSTRLRAAAPVSSAAPPSAVPAPFQPRGPSSSQLRPGVALQLHEESSSGRYMPLHEGSSPGRYMPLHEDSSSGRLSLVDAVDAVDTRPPRLGRFRGGGRVGLVEHGVGLRHERRAADRALGLGVRRE